MNKNSPRQPRLKYGTYAPSSDDRRALAREPYSLWIYERYPRQPVTDLFDNWPEEKPEPDPVITIETGRSTMPLLEKLKEVSRVRKNREKYTYYPLLPPVSQDFLSGKIPAVQSSTYINYWGGDSEITGTELAHPVWHPLRASNFGAGSVTVKNLDFYPDGLTVTWGDPNILTTGDFEAVVRLPQYEFNTHYRSDFGPTMPSEIECSIEEDLWPFGPDDAVVINNSVMFLRRRAQVIPIRFSSSGLQVFLDRIHEIPWQAWCSIPEPIIDFFDLVGKKS
jgi:hypothetical protein